MRHILVIVLVVSSMFSGLAVAQNITPEPILPGTLQWWSPPNMPGLQGAWVLGAEDKPGLYLFRVKIASGVRIPPHSHPDERNITVLAGTIYVGVGEQFDEVRMVALPTGAVFVAPAKVLHYVWAKEGDAAYQESGIGPTGSSFVKR
jgi:quercetin dioxygenase-like cupin family protein